MTVKDLIEFIFENYYKQVGFIKKKINRYYSVKNKTIFSSTCY